MTIRTYLELTDMTMEHLIDYKNHTIIIWRGRRGSDGGTKRKVLYTIGNMKFATMTDAKEYLSKGERK